MRRSRWWTWCRWLTLRRRVWRASGRGQLCRGGSHSKFGTIVQEVGKIAMRRRWWEEQRDECLLRGSRKNLQKRWWWDYHKIVSHRTYFCSVSRRSRHGYIFICVYHTLLVAGTFRSTPRLTAGFPKASRCLRISYMRLRRSATSTSSTRPAPAIASANKPANNGLNDVVDSDNLAAFSISFKLQELTKTFGIGVSNFGMCDVCFIDNNFWL